MEFQASDAGAIRTRMASNTAQLDTSFLSGANAAFIEELYARYAADPTSVDESWRTLFAGLGRGAGGGAKPAWGLKSGSGMTGALAGLAELFRETHAERVASDGPGELPTR